jgi:hypothetical protein
MLLRDLYLWEFLRISRSCMHCSCLIMRPPLISQQPRTETNTPPNENMSALVTFACGMLIKHLNNPSLALLQHLPKAILLASKRTPYSLGTTLLFTQIYPCFALETFGQCTLSFLWVLEAIYSLHFVDQTYGFSVMN